MSLPIKVQKTRKVKQPADERSVLACNPTRTDPAGSASPRVGIWRSGSLISVEDSPDMRNSPAQSIVDLESPNRSVPGPASPVSVNCGKSQKTQCVGQPVAKSPAESFQSEQSIPCQGDYDMGHGTEESLERGYEGDESQVACEESQQPSVVSQEETPNDYPIANPPSEAEVALRKAADSLASLCTRFLSPMHEENAVGSSSPLSFPSTQPCDWRNFADTFETPSTVSPVLSDLATHSLQAPSSPELFQDLGLE